MPDPTTANVVSLEQLCCNTLRILAIDAVQAANSGHPGAPMGLAPAAYVLWTRHLRHDPRNPDWPDRDRFVLSCGHASMLMYGVLHLCGYKLSMDEIKRFRQVASQTPGHPEFGVTPGVETTTGPLGQGFANAVGMAMAEFSMAATFNRDSHRLVDHHTYFIASDGDLMEGISHEAASLAGHWKLSKLIGIYDANEITIDGATSLSCSENTAARFESYGWHVLHVADGNNVVAIDAALAEAKAETERPSLIVVRTHIGFGSPNKQDTADAHGAPLGADEVAATKRQLGWPSTEPFFVPAEALAEWRKCLDRGAHLRSAWQHRMDDYSRHYPAEAVEFERRLDRRLPAGWEDGLPRFVPADGDVATRKASGKALNAIANRLPELLGGSADLAGSVNTVIGDGAPFGPHTRGERNIHFGVREHAMGGIMNGISLHGGLRPFGGTFLIFSDYMRPSIRLAAMMNRSVIYLFSHDSIGLGEDGPTHQPVETLATLRAIPGLIVIRPADANETVEAWRFTIESRDTPVAIVLTRQGLPVLDRERFPPAGEITKGGYVLSEAQGGQPRAVIIASGSEVKLAVEAQAVLEKEGLPVRVVNMASMELFAAQTDAYRASVLPPGVTVRVAIEAAHPMPWYRWVGDRGSVIGIETFGSSGPAEELFEVFGITTANLVSRVRRLASA